MTLVCVPGGAFSMGAEDDDLEAEPDERPAHPITLDAFWIDRTEVTNEDFAICVAADMCKARPVAPGSTGVASRTHPDYYHDPAYADFPVLIYTFDEADAYCRCMGRRLPTEAEFEAAARGTDGRAYPWGDELDCDHASFVGCTDDMTDVETPEAGASPYGALNMAGNVWEWVADRYSDAYYSVSPESDPTGPTTGTYRVRRGGGFRSNVQDLRITERASGRPLHYFDGQMGFRCAMSSSP
jgi:formylglycine-generating enzyme required for sulfatase activity